MASPGLAAVLALGLAVVLVLAWTNRRRWYAVLRPNWGRVLGAQALTIVTPLAVHDWTPWIPGPTLLFMALTGMPVVLLGTLV